MNTELLAVNKVSDMFAACPRLAPRISSNDKTPLTDGSIDIYESIPQSIENFIGRVPVQVKGRNLKKKSKKNKWGKPYTINRENLTAHLKDSGVLYLVVDVDGKTNERKVYYALLNPFKIHDMLDSMTTKQKSKNFDLKPLPEDPDQIYAIIKLAVQTQKEPKSQVTFDEHIMKSAQRCTIISDKSMDFSKPVHLRRELQDFSFVVTTNSGLQIPVSGDLKITPKEYSEQPTDLTVSSGDVTFTQPNRLRINQSTIALQLSQNLSILIEETTEGPIVRFGAVPNSNLGGRFKDQSFVLEVLQTSAFSINGQEHQVKASEHHDLSEFRQQLSILETLISLFNYLNADPFHVDLDSVTDQQLNQLLMLHSALVEGHEITQQFTEPGRVYQPVGPWGFELVCMQGKEEDRWVYHDLFDPELPLKPAAYDEDNAKHHWRRVTPYEVVDPKNLPNILNLHLENVVTTYENIGDYEETTNLANRMVRNFIDAADASEGRRDEFLEAADQLNAWTLKGKQENPDFFVNRWQIAARRKGTLSKIDRESVRELKRRATKGEIQSAELTEIACSILLGDVEDVDFHLKNLTESDSKDLRSWPIWTYHQNVNLPKPHAK